ncbi:cobalamin biosynthesis protein [Marinobacter sp. DUT-3]|uniref:cobalamin biosynthesis protein n=1 Tax=unclassified Marinobacter TaxID=83889 RepID=UPI00387B7F4C
MTVAGFGHRRGAQLSSLAEVLERLIQHYGQVDRLVALADKAELVQLLGAERGLPVVLIEGDVCVGVETLTRSRHSQHAKNTGSVAEALALLGAGQDSRLLGPRQISADRMATGAIAEHIIL